MFVTVFSQIIFAILLSSVIYFYFWFEKRRNYWKNKNVPFIPSIPLFGNLRDIVLFKKSVAGKLDDFYRDPCVKDSLVFGVNLFHKPTLIVKDPEIIKNILIKDFNIFSNRHTRTDEITDTLGGLTLFSVRNPSWKQIRIKLTPVFTSGKIKQMFNLIKTIGNELNNLLLNRETKKFTLEIKEVCACYATDVIASCAFGVEANSLKNPNGEFRENGRNIFKANIIRAYEFLSFFFLPEFAMFFKLKLFTGSASKFIRSTIELVMNEREKNHIHRNDLIDTLINLKNSERDQNSPKKSTEVVFNGDILYAQAASFFSAGFETSSSVMSFALFEIANQPEIQMRLRNEIKDILQKYDGNLCYDSINEMHYLDMVVTETLRLYPSLPFLDRLCEPLDGQQDYSLQPYVNFSIPKGMPIIIPIFSIQRDPKYYPNPEKFDPERFANKENIKPYVYMPFGLGPRNCIGERFGLIQVKSGLINFLRNHSYLLNEKTKKIILEEKALFLASQGGIFLDVVRD